MENDNISNEQSNVQLDEPSNEQSNVQLDEQSNEQSNEQLNEQSNEQVTKKSKKIVKKMVIVILLLLLIVSIGTCVYFKFEEGEPATELETEETEVENETEVDNQYSAYRISSNSLEDFDLYFLQSENEEKNTVYSPLSIKYGLAMLNEGAAGKTKAQISNILGSYNAKKYANSNNMSLANALFVKNTYMDSIKESYVDTLLNKYNAEVVYDSFSRPNNLNSWVSNKTFNLINNLYDDISEEEFILANALAIDMEWVNQIQSEDQFYHVSYPNRDFYEHVPSLYEQGHYAGIRFEGVSYYAKSVQLAAVINKYDIINIIGEDNIRETVGTAYEAWLATDERYECDEVIDVPDVDTYLDQYIAEISEGYEDISSSTDFEFYSNDDVKVFAKDLKQYDGTTLQYVGIMPKNITLNEYIKNIKAADVNTLISNLKSIELNNFTEGVITHIKGTVPMFKISYQLDLINDLNTLGITDVFDLQKANLSNLSSEKVYINSASHKANIEFSNDGIKASAVSPQMGVGNAYGGCPFFYYNYKVPVKEIDLTFDHPYLFLIRDKESGEVWFVGTVYEPVERQILE